MHGVFNDFFQATNGTKDAGFESKDILQQNGKAHLLVLRILACPWQMQKKSYSRLFSDYQAIIGRLPIILKLADNRLCRLVTD